MEKMENPRRRTHRNSPGCKIIGIGIVMLTMFALFLPLINATVDYTSDTMTICGDSSCTTTLYSGTMFVEEDNQWKSYEEARSLKDKGFEIVILEDDKDYPVEVLDFNSTSIEVDLGHWSFLNDPVDLRLYKYDQDKVDTYCTNALTQEQEDACANPDLDFKNTYTKVVDKDEVFNIFDLGSKVAAYDFAIGDILEFGPNSTTIKLQTADTQNLGDTDVNAGLPDTNSGTAQSMDIRISVGEPKRLYLNFNISDVPSGQRIVNSMLYLRKGAVVVPEAIGLIELYKIHEAGAWAETVITWNNQPCGTAFDDSAKCEVVTPTDTLNPTNSPNVWVDWNVTGIVGENYAAKLNDSGFVLKADNEGTFSALVEFRTKEYLADIKLRPYLNVTYESGTPLVDIVYPEDSTPIIVTELNYTTNSDEKCWYSLDSWVTNGSKVDAGLNWTGLTSVDTNNWTVWCNNSIGETFDQVNFTTDLTAPAVNITYPLDGTTFYTDSIVNSNITIDINFTVGDASFCWIYNNTDNTNTSAVSSGTNFSLWVDYGAYTHFAYCNDTTNNINQSSVDAEYKYTLFNNNDTDFNFTAYETATENFLVNMRYYPSDWTSTTGTLVYNGTEYTGTDVSSGDDLIFTKTFGSTLLNNLGDREVYWKIGLTNSSGTHYYNSSFANQSVYPTILGFCNTSLTETYINFTFEDEEAQAAMNGSIDLLTMPYWLGDGSIKKELTFTNTSDNNPSTSFCLTNNETLHNNLTIQYSLTGYPQRRYTSAADLTNVVTNKLLYLLASADGIYSTFIVLDSGGVPVTDAGIIVERQFSGVWTIIGQDTVGSDGAATFFLNPNYDVRLTVSSARCTTTVQSIRPSQSAYTIQLQCTGGVSDEIYISPLDGIKYSRTPLTGIIESGLQNFTYQLVSSKDNIVSMKFSLINSSNNAVLNTTSSVCAPAGCFTTMWYNVQPGADFKGEYMVNIGNGLFYLERDARWREIDMTPSGSGVRTTFADFWLNAKDIFDNEEIPNASDFNRLMFFFFVMCILLAVGNSYSGMDTSNPGYFLTIMTFVIWMGSLPGGYTGEGFFFYNNLTGIALFNNYILALIMTVITIGHFITSARRAQQ